jgi:hypothetical protein
MARTSLLRADAVFVVTRPGTKGLHSVVRLLADLIGIGVDPKRIVAVINQAPRHPRGRAEITAALADLLDPVGGGSSMAAPLFLPTRRVDQALRDGALIPAPLPSLIASAFDAVTARAGAVGFVPAREPELVVPGSIGTWIDRDDLS